MGSTSHGLALKQKMKALRSADLLTTPRFVPITAFAIIFFTFFYIGTLWSEFDCYHPLSFFTTRQSPLSPSVIDLSANYNVTLSDTSSSLFSNQTTNVYALPSAAPPPAVAVAATPPPPSHWFGIVDKNGAMRDDFIVGEFDPQLPEMLEGAPEKVDYVGKVKVENFQLCPLGMKDIIPCLDNEEEIRKLNSTERGEKFERHCPEEGKNLNCLVPAPKDYKAPIPWPKSRDQMVPDIAFGNQTTVVLDVGCEVASFSAFLLSSNVAPLSIAPKDAHNNQIQFALERGVPEMVAALATKHLPYPSQAFDMIHCSWCQINWTRNEMENITAQICWELVKKAGYIAIWQKPLNNSCYVGRAAGVGPPLCETDNDPDNIWYVDLKACITRLPDNGYGVGVTNWPARLHHPPDRLQTVELDSYASKKELFMAESKHWNDIVGSYVHAYHWKQINLRNVMDIRAGFGGFAAALIDLQVNAWVMNVVPVSGPNTLPVIYDRGLVGVLHDWYFSNSF